MSVDYFVDGARFAPAAPPVMLRPQPPELPAFWTAPAPDLATWATDLFVSSSGRFHVEEHAHLANAVLGFLWTTAPNRQKGKTVLATAEIPRPPQIGGAWARARYWQQLEEWWPESRPDFLITVWTGCGELSDARFCQVLHHELRHCAQAFDSFGSPKFDRETGRPVFAIVGHDWEGFASEIALFGVQDDSLRGVLAAAANAPRFSSDAVAGVCGTCGRMAA